MSELAFNIQGDTFEPPATASGWRVRRLKKAGAPEVVYGRDGFPLVIPVEAGMDELKAAVDATGRYRLDPVDETGKAVKDAVPAYVCVNRDGAEAGAASSAASSRPPALSPMDHVIVEAMRMNSEIARSVIDRFPLMMEAAAVLLRAADGAGLPARPGMATDGDDDGENGDAAPQPGPVSALQAMFAQVVPLLVTGFMNGGGKGKVPSFAEMFDWRKAAASAKPAMDATDASSTTSAKTVESSTASTGGIEPMVPPLDPTTIAHFMAVRAMLMPEESALAGRIAKQLSAAEMRGLFDELAKLSVPDAVARVRQLLAGPRMEGGAS